MNTSDFPKADDAALAAFSTRHASFVASLDLTDYPWIDPDHLIT